MTTAMFLSSLIMPVGALVIGVIMLWVSRRATAQYDARIRERERADRASIAGRTGA